MRLKQFCTTIGIIGSFLAHYIGGWDKMIEALVMLMIIDYVSGVVVALLNKSRKTENGGLDSKVGWTGLFKKVLILLAVVVGYWVDNLLGIDLARNAVIIGFAANEALSFFENLGQAGIKLPNKVVQVIEVLKKTDEG